MEKGEIKEQLLMLSTDASAALAMRLGLRVLPWVAMSKEGQVLARWKPQERAQHLLAVLSAYDVVVMAVWDKQAPRLREVARARRSAAADASDVVAFAAFAAAAFAAGDAFAAEAAASFAAGAAVNGTYGIMREFKKSKKTDLQIVRKSGGRGLIESPLWQGPPPVHWIEQLGRFREAVRALDCGFDFWLDWYEALCRGEPVDVEQLRQRVFLPDSIAHQSPSQINAYLTSLSAGVADGPLNRVRTIFIGDGEAGKTSLIRVLYGEPVVEGIEAKTPGIAIREWKVPGTPITASFWDFGGQVMVHATHQLFLRESCLYVLLVSSRDKEKATERAEYWLEHVKSFGKGAPVLIVANKADKEPVRLDESLLLAKYPGMIQGFFQLACTQVRGRFRAPFAKFKAAFCQQLQAVGLNQVQFHQSHFAVLQNLRKRTPKQAFLTKEDYIALCRECKVDQQGVLDSEWLLTILDQLGVIVHFPEMVEVDEYILNPRWLTYGVYTIMYHDQPRVSRSEVVKLLSSQVVEDQDGNVLTYPASKCRIVFEAMEKYKLCYFLTRDRNQLIIPALLPSDIKHHHFDTTRTLEFDYQFESFLPRHLISELIVECHEDIASEDGQDVVWQHGVLLHNEVHKADALIQADYHFRRLSIWLTRSPAAADFLAVLRDKVERIVKRLDIRYQRNIRLPREALLDTGSMPAGPEWADFGQILIMRNKNRPIYDHPSGSEYSISKILGLFESQARAEAGGNTTIHIHQSTLGDLTVAGKVVDSFNRGGRGDVG